MMSKEIWHALSAKADWEGGWPEYVLHYGIDTQAIDDPVFRSKVYEVENAWSDLQALIEAHINEYGEYPNE